VFSKLPRRAGLVTRTSLFQGQMTHVDHGGVVVAGEVQPDGIVTGVVVEADAVAEQDRRDVQVDLIDQSPQE
jgi:hypothetical protein